MKRRNPLRRRELARQPTISQLIARMCRDIESDDPHVSMLKAKAMSEVLRAERLMQGG